MNKHNVHLLVIVIVAHSGTLSQLIIPIKKIRPTANNADSQKEDRGESKNLIINSKNVQC